LRGLGKNPTVLRGILRELELRRQKDIQEMQRKKADLEREMRAIAREMNEAVTLTTAASRFAELQERSRALDHNHAEVLSQLQLRNTEGADPQRVEETFLAFDPLWEQLSTGERESLIRLLVDRIQYDGPTGTITLGFRSTAARDLCHWAAEHFPEKV
jgi:site-specific DNA recombinase